MNRVAAALIALGALAGTVYGATLAIGEVRETTLESSCIANGQTPLWGHGQDTSLPDGLLDFHCR